MATNLVRFEKDGAAKWGVVAGSGASLLEGDYPSTAALIEQGEADWRAAKKRLPTASLDTDENPVARDCALPHLLPGR